MSHTPSPEVQMQYMRPRQLEEAIRRFPVVYVPFGLIEWHGKHLPLGTDALKAHGFLIRTAEQVGGVVYPPVYFSETFGNELQPMFTTLFSRLKATGFRVILAVSGHNTFNQVRLIREALDPVLATGEVAGDVQWEFESTAQPEENMKYMPDGRLFVDGRETTIQRDAQCSSDHAAKWETSDIMCLHPELVDMKELGTEPFPLDMRRPWGIGGLDPRVHASAEVGRKCLELSAAALGRRARELLATLPQEKRTFSLPAISSEHWWAV